MSVETQMQAAAEMPRYQSHKTVWALKIAKIEYEQREHAVVEDRHREEASIAIAEKRVFGLGHAEMAQSLANGEAGKPYRATATIYPAEEGYAPFEVDALYLKKHNPQVGGYYIVYADGYKSWSPAQAFEEGYTRA